MPYPDGTNHRELDEPRAICPHCGVSHEEQDMVDTDCGLVCTDGFDEGYCQPDDLEPDYEEA